MIRGPIFRDLPLELRLQIYEYLFVQSESIYVNKDWSEPTDLITALSAHLQVDAEEMQRVYYRENAFGYLLTNLKTEKGVYDYQGLIRHLENLGALKRTWLKRIDIVCFFSTPERVAVAKEGIQKWLGEGDRGIQIDVCHFTERYWCCNPQ
jgi:hypothetical protein